MRRLMERPHWVGWKRDGKKKPPINVHTGQIDNGLSPSSQGTYEEALARVQRDQLPGLGFVMSEDDGLTAIDLDDCFDPATGQATPETAEILAAGESYGKRSPSGTGLRFFVEGKIAKNIHRPDIGIEVFWAGQYVTVTGAQINGTPTTIRPALRTLALLMKRAGREEKRTNQGEGGGEARGGQHHRRDVLERRQPRRPRQPRRMGPELVSAGPAIDQGLACYIARSIATSRRTCPSLKMASRTSAFTTKVTRSAERSAKAGARRSCW
jgi:hypothetical protein